MITSKIIEDSVSSKSGIRLTTFQLSYPRYIHAEVMTHRVFSRNASSSRAVPVKRMNQRVTDEGIIFPSRFGKNQAGMSPSDDNLIGEDLEKAKKIWEEAANACIDASVALAELGLHKQWSNRLLEWFTPIHVVLSSTDFSNFFLLRDDFRAQDEIQLLARSMKESLYASTPVVKNMGEWHLPYVSKEDAQAYPTETLAKISAARCARVSYLNHDGKPSTLDEDLALYARLAESFPPHLSPLEHSAVDTGTTERFANYRGWASSRYLYENT